MEAALGEVERGARWVKVIGDFPRLPEFTDTAATYSMTALKGLCAAAHDCGARVAIHSTFGNIDEVIEAGVDSIEHGMGVDEATVMKMASRGIAWTPTLCAITGAADNPAAAPELRKFAHEARDRFRQFVPMAVRA